MPRRAQSSIQTSFLTIFAGLVLGALPFAGCGSSDDTTVSGDTADAASTDSAPTDSSALDSSAGDTSTINDSGSPDAAKTYATSTIAAMRSAGTNGNFELDTVVLTYSLLAGAKAFVIDPTGGNFSAMQISCASPCALASKISGTMDGHDVSIKGTYTKTDAAHGSVESFVPDTWIDDGEATMIPGVGSIDFADAVKGASKPELYFQKVGIALPDTLVMFDFSPPEFAVSGASACPYQKGFGMVLKTGAPTLTAAETCCATATTAACASGATAQTTTNAQEILVGTEFAPIFSYTTDCRCATGTPALTVPSATAQITSALGGAGIFLYEVPAGSTTGFQYFAPTRSEEFDLQ